MSNRKKLFNWATGDVKEGSGGYKKSRYKKVGYINHRKKLHVSKEFKETT